MYGRDYPEAHDPGPEDNPHDDGTAALLALVKTGDWLDAQVFPPTQWAVPGLIPEGFGLLTGPPKAGKSWAVLGIALAVASGGTALGRIPTGPARPVLYCALEDGDRRLQWRSRRLLHDQPIPALLHTVTAATPGQIIPLLRAWLDQHRDRRPMVILDTLGKVMPNAIPGEGAYQRDYRIGGTLKGVIDAHPGSTLLVVHHVRKASGEDWMDSTSGTNGLNGSADFTVNLARPRNQITGTIRITGRDVAENEYAVVCADGVWTLDGANLDAAATVAEQARATANLGDRSAEIVAYVNAQPAPVTSKQVEEALDIPDARRYLARLADAGRLARQSRGQYSSVPSVPSVPSDEAPESLSVSRVVQDDAVGTLGTDGTPVPVVHLPCRVCRQPMHPRLIEAGETAHPLCGEAS